VILTGREGVCGGKGELERIDIRSKGKKRVLTEMGK